MLLLMGFGETNKQQLIHWTYTSNTREGDRIRCHDSPADEMLHIILDWVFSIPRPVCWSLLPPKLSACHGKYCLPPPAGLPFSIWSSLLPQLSRKYLASWYAHAFNPHRHCQLQDRRKVTKHARTRKCTCTYLITSNEMAQKIVCVCVCVCGGGGGGDCREGLKVVPCGYLPPMMGASKDDIESMISKQIFLPPLFTCTCAMSEKYLTRNLKQ